MTDINWITVADRLLDDSRSLEKVQPTAATLMEFLSYAIRDGVDAAGRFLAEKAANAAADLQQQIACDDRVHLPRGWREAFVKDFMERLQRQGDAPSPLSRPQLGDGK